MIEGLTFPLTRQQMVDIGCAGLAKQHWIKACAYGSCLYRGPNNTKCWLGHLLPDEAIKYIGNQQAAIEVYDSLKEQCMLHLCPFKCSDVNFVVQGQACHDRSQSPSGMMHNFREFIKQYELVIPPCLVEDAS